MAAIRPIRTEEDYQAALARIDEIFHAEPGTPDGDELDVLADLVELYEMKQYPIDPPNPIDAIKFHMDQTGMTRRELIPIIGSRSKVSEVLSGKQDITMSMARALHQHLGISAEVLLQKPGADFDPAFNQIDPRRFPLRRMANLGWIPNVPDLVGHAEELISSLMERAGCRRVVMAPLYRRNDSRRVNAKTDEYALKAWCLQVMATARERVSSVSYKPGTVTPEFLRSVARLSPLEDGPRRSRDFLAESGISLEIVKHLPNTYLDGAALQLSDGRPVIGLTLRYDRIDNFWFCLLHELAHVGLHLNGGEDSAFTDDHSLREIAGATAAPKEVQADDWAEEALVPAEAWENSVASETPTPMAVYDLAYELGVHPAVVAGKVRYESGNYRLLSQLVGSGQVSRQFLNLHT